MQPVSDDLRIPTKEASCLSTHVSYALLEYEDYCHQVW